MLYNEMGGVVGSLTCGAVSDRYFSTPLIICLLSCILCALAVAPLPTTPFMGFDVCDRFQFNLVCRILLFIAGYAINVPKTLLNLCLRRLLPPDIGGSAEGLFSLVGQLGASLSGVGIGRVIDIQGWKAYRGLMLLPSLMAALSLVIPTLDIGKLRMSVSDIYKSFIQNARMESSSTVVDLRKSSKKKIQ